jgi:hypothetical protein
LQCHHLVAGYLYSRLTAELYNLNYAAEFTAVQENSEGS